LGYCGGDGERALPERLDVAGHLIAEGRCRTGNRPQILSERAYELKKVLQSLRNRLPLGGAGRCIRFHELRENVQNRRKVVQYPWAIVVAGRDGEESGETMQYTQDVRFEG
jgi:hypothetical protein